MKLLALSEGFYYIYSVPRKKKETTLFFNILGMLWLKKSKRKQH